MKKRIIIFLILPLVLASCTGVRSITTGLEDEAYLEFIGNPSYYEDGVNVSVDDVTFFKAFVIEDNAKRPTGEVYAISPGKHLIRVTHYDNVIFEKTIFVSAQETKQIHL